MNVRFTRLVPFINEVFFPDKKIINSKTMALAICDLVLKNKTDYPFNSYEGIKLYLLSLRLAKIFTCYDKNNFIPSSWEKKLFEELKKKYNQYAYLSDLASCDISFKGKVFLFGFRHLDEVYETPLASIGCEMFFQQEKVANQEIEICKAPSIEREVEYLHGKICKLINEDPKLKLYDILVYAPNLKKYEAAIKKVFFTSGDENFPNIPYVISTSSNDQSNTYEALKILNDIIHTKSFTREEFITLLSNLAVQKARKITSQDVTNIVKTLDNLNVYRNDSKDDEWLYGIRRILLAKLVGQEDIVNLKNKEYMPYSGINLTDDLINKLVAAISDLESMLYELNKNQIDINDIKKHLDKWLSYSKLDEFEQNYFYESALDILNIISLNNFNLPLDIIFSSMLDECKGISLKDANAINGGVTFIEFDESNILASKYIFLLGMSSNNLPRANHHDILDENPQKEEPSDIDKATFNCLLNNAYKVFSSYVGIDLKTMEEFSKSSLLKGDDQYELSLGENREYDKLYAKTEFRKKEYALNLASGVKSTTSAAINKIKSIEINKPESIKYKRFADFLEEPFITKFDYLFKDYDTSFEDEKKSFEPINIDSMEKAEIKTAIMLELFKATPKQNIIFEKAQINHELPYEYTYEDFKKEWKEVEAYKSTLKGGQLEEPFSLRFTSWNLDVNDSFVLKIDDNNANGKIYYFYSLRKPQKNHLIPYLLRLYIISLAYIVKNKITFATINLNESKEYKISYNEAQTILEEIYADYFDFKNTIIFNIDKIDSPTYDKVFSDYNLWQYHQNDKKFIDIKESAGYTRQGFDKKILEYKNKIKKWIKYM